MAISDLDLTGGTIKFGKLHEFLGKLRRGGEGGHFLFNKFSCRILVFGMAVLQCSSSGYIFVKSERISSKHLSGRLGHAGVGYKFGPIV